MSLSRITSSITITIAVMSLLFVVCQMPKLIPDLYEVIMCSEKRQGRVCYLGEDMRYVVEVRMHSIS